MCAVIKRIEKRKLFRRNRITIICDTFQMEKDDIENTYGKQFLNIKHGLFYGSLMKRLDRRYMEKFRGRTDENYKFLLYVQMYDDLNEKLGEFSERDYYFRNTLLQAYHETLSKMIKNKKSSTGTMVKIGKIVFGIAPKVIAGVGTYLFTENVITANGMSVFGEGNIVWTVVALVLVFGVINWIIEHTLAYFKPKETWIRHSIHFYNLYNEISEYLDDRGKYQGMDDIEAYETFKSNVIPILQGNIDKFQTNMEKEGE